VKELVPTIITSVTSIVIALITAGFFNMMKEKRAKQSSRNKLSQASVTYERCSDGLERITEKIQNVFVSHYNWLIKQTMDDGLFIHDCELIPDIATRALIKKFGTQSMVSLPIMDKENHLIALLCMDWVFSEHVEVYCENEEFTKNFREDFKKDTQSVRNFLI